MKITVPGTILATSLNVGVVLSNGAHGGTAETIYPGETYQSSDASSAAEIVSVSAAPEEFYTTVQDVPVEIEWTKTAEIRFHSLALKEALETLTASELVELEQLTIARRKHTAPPASADEILRELKQWQIVNRVFAALNDYVEQIGLPRTTFTNRS